jgi:uncharacterized protein HemY
MINTKVGRQDLENLNELKCNRTEVLSIEKRFNVMQKEMTHLLVLLNESLKLNLSKSNETKLAKENRTHELCS